MSFFSKSTGILFEKATVHTAGHLGVIRSGSVYIEDQHIVWVGPADDWDTHLMKNAHTLERINCEGEHITPGFVDAHVHLGLYPEGYIGEPKDLNELTKAFML